jgi:hypothetical protein
MFQVGDLTQELLGHDVKKEVVGKGMEIDQPDQALLVVNHTDYVCSGVSQHRFGYLVQGSPSVDDGWPKVQCRVDDLDRCVSMHDPVGAHCGRQSLPFRLGLDFVQAAYLVDG